MARNSQTRTNDQWTRGGGRWWENKNSTNSTSTPNDFSWPVWTEAKKTKTKTTSCQEKEARKKFVTRKKLSKLCRKRHTCHIAPSPTTPRHTYFATFQQRVHHGPFFQQFFEIFTFTMPCHRDQTGFHRVSQTVRPVPGHKTPPQKTHTTEHGIRCLHPTKTRHRTVYPAIPPLARCTDHLLAS